MSESVDVSPWIGFPVVLGGIFAMFTIGVGGAELINGNSLEYALGTGLIYGAIGVGVFGSLTVLHYILHSVIDWFDSE